MKKGKLLLLLLGLSLFSSVVFADTVVSGVVTDEKTGEPLIGATVIEQGTTNNGTITDLDGKYELTVKDGSNIVISSVGFKTQILKGAKSMSIQMAEETQALEELVVTGYTTQRKVDLTGAVSVMDMNEPVSEGSANVLNSMEGRLPGVQIISDAAPGGGGTTVRIRGMSTINGNEPLYVIDGVPTNSNLNSLNPADIESIQVLKDASSASIYGSRAANGVIIITTKRAQDEKVSVNIGYSATAQTVAKQYQMLNSDQWGQVYWQANKNAGLTATHPFYTVDASGNPQLNEYLDEAQKVKSTNNNWQNDVYSTAWTHDVNASVAYKSKLGSLYFSGSYIDQNGLMDYTYFNRATARLNSTVDICKWVSVGENLTVATWNDNGYATQDDRGIPYTAMRQHPAIPVKDSDGNFTSPLQLCQSDIANPVHQLYNGRDNTNQSLKIFGNAYIEINPWVKGLYLKSNIGVEHEQYNSKALNRKIESSDVNSMSRAYGQGDTWTWTNTIRYENVWKNKHHFDALAGVEAINYTYDWINAGRKTYAFEDAQYMVLDAGETDQTNSGSVTSWSLFSFFAKADYNYADRYLVSATVRRDATSRLYYKNNYAWFPSFSAAWRFTEEPFFPRQKYFTNGKLRVGWGQNGNSAISNNYASYSTYAYNIGTGAYDLYGSNTSTVAGVIVSSTGNPDLKWETTSQTNIGLDLGFFDNTLTISADWYLKDTKDMLTVPPVLSVAGENAATWRNTGDMRNMGVELTVAYNSPDYNGFSWNAAFNLSHYKNTVVKLNDFTTQMGGDVRLITGQPMGVYYGYVVDGIFQNEDEVLNSAIQQGKGVGRLKYRDLDGDGKITDADQTIIGDPNPDLALGLNLDFKYKGITLSFFFNSELGFDILNYTKRQLDFCSYGGNSVNRGIGVLDAWTPENTGATIPMISAVDANNETRTSTYFVEDGSYLKLKYIKLSYDFPRKITKLFRSEGLNLFFQVENVFTATKYSGLDPELQIGNYGQRVDNAAYPRARSFSLGLNLKF